MCTKFTSIAMIIDYLESNMDFFSSFIFSSLSLIRSTYCIYFTKFIVSVNIDAAINLTWKFISKANCFDIKLCTTLFAYNIKLPLNRFFFMFFFVFFFCCVWTIFFMAGNDGINIEINSEEILLQIPESKTIMVGYALLHNIASSKPVRSNFFFAFSFVFFCINYDLRWRRREKKRIKPVNVRTRL